MIAHRNRVHSAVIMQGGQVERKKVPIEILPSPLPPVLALQNSNYASGKEHPLSNLWPCMYIIYVQWPMLLQTVRQSKCALLASHCRPVSFVLKLYIPVGWSHYSALYNNFLSSQHALCCTVCM